MSMTPFWRDWWDDFDFSRPHRLFDQHFGSALSRDELWDSFWRTPRRSVFNRYHRPWTSSVARQDSGSSIAADKEKFQVILDVQQFSPKEISVKTNGQNIIVEGKHEEKQDEHGFISRHFVRRYLLPQDHDVDKVVSSLSSDGVLTITAPKKGTQEHKSERIIPITQIGPAKSTVTPIAEEKMKTRIPETNQDDHRYSSRFTNPLDHDFDKFSSSSLSDGVTTITGPKTNFQEPRNERIIPITQSDSAKSTPIIEEL